MRRLLLGLGLSAASVVLLWRLIDWRTTLDILKGAEPGFILLALVCLVLSLGAKAARWRLLLPDEVSPSLPRLYRIMHISYLLNNVFPARLGDVARVAMTTRQPGLRLGHALSSLITERVTDSLTLLAGLLLVSPFLPLPAGYDHWLRLAWLVAGIAALVAIAVVLGRGAAARLRIPFARRLAPEGSFLRAELSSFSAGWRLLFSGGHFLRIWGWSWFAWVGAFAINFSLMRAIGIDAPFTVAVLLTCTTNLAMLIPSSPGYVGVFHAAATLSLVPFDVGRSTALSFAILAHLVNVIPVSLIGALFLLLGRESLSLRGLRASPGPLDQPPAGL